MARHVRIEYPGALYHVTARGNDRQTIFRTVEDRKHLLEVLTEALQRYEVHLFAYVLMGNHYHLVVQTEHPNLNRFMHYINTAYTVWMNRRNRRTGHLFEGPYKAIVMEEEGYLLSATGYVHLNPVRIRSMKDKPIKERLMRVKDYAWSSYRAYTMAMLKKAEPKVSCDRVWGELGAGNKREGRRMYRDYIRGWLENEEMEKRKPKEKRDETIFNPFFEVRLGCFLGTDQFRDFIQGFLMKDGELSQEVVGHKEWGREKPIEELLRVAAKVRGVRWEDLKQRSWNHVERDLAIYLSRESGEKGLKEIGKVFNIGVAATSHAITRIKCRMKEQKRFEKEVNKAKDEISKILKT